MEGLDARLAVNDMVPWHVMRRGHRRGAVMAGSVGGGQAGVLCVGGECGVDCVDG